MASDDLRPFSYCVLALVGEGGAGPHDIVRMMRAGRVYWDAAESQWYAEPKRLEKLGYLRSTREPGRTRPRTHYRLTDAGRAALARWAPEPTPFPRLQNEGTVRLLAGDLADDADIARSFAAMRPEVEELLAAQDAADRIAEELPHRTKYLRLNHWYGRRLLELHLEWIAEVERVLGGE
jgi:DNA-binding PadR family transcriptional regulator